jgi:hypothetical protein
MPMANKIVSVRLFSAIFALGFLAALALIFCIGCFGIKWNPSASPSADPPRFTYFKTNTVHDVDFVFEVKTWTSGMATSEAVLYIQEMGRNVPLLKMPFAYASRKCMVENGNLKIQEWRRMQDGRKSRLEYLMSVHSSDDN